MEDRIQFWIQITDETIMDQDPQSRNPDLWILIQ
jgi:hypothetical protein